MTNQNPITPPPELVAKWASSMCGYYEAARWGADQDLEECCEWIPRATPWDEEQLRAARRPPVIPEIIEVDGYTYRLVK